MKKFFAILLCAALALTMCSAAFAETKLEKIKAAGEIHLATSPDFAPSEFIDDTKTGQDQYVGADIELAKYIADYLGVDLVIDAMDFSAVQAAVTMGTADIAISGFAYTEERAEACEMSIFYNVDREDEKGQRVIVTKERAEELATQEALNGCTIACQNGSLQYNLTSEQLPNATIQPIADLGTAVQMLINGNVDAIACSGETAELFCSSYDEITLSDFQFEYESEGNVVLMTKGETDLAEAVNAALTEVNEQGLYATWKADATELAQNLGIEVND